MIPRHPWDWESSMPAMYHSLFLQQRDVLYFCRPNAETCIWTTADTCFYLQTAGLTHKESDKAHWSAVAAQFHGIIGRSKDGDHW